MTTLNLNLRVHHACDKREHTTALTLNPVRLNSGLIRLEGTRCDGRPLHLVALHWWGATGCDCYLIDEWPHSPCCPHGALQLVGGPMSLAELQAAAREGLTIGEVVCPISFPPNCSHCGQGADWCQCQPTLPEGDGTPA